MNGRGGDERRKAKRRHRRGDERRRRQRRPALDLSLFSSFFSDLQCHTSEGMEGKGMREERQREGTGEGIGGEGDEGDLLWTCRYSLLFSHT